MIFHQLKIFFMLLLLSSCSYANTNMNILIKNVSVKEEAVSVDVVIINNSKDDFYIYGKNICTRPLLDRNLFDISYNYNSGDNLLAFAGIQSDVESGFVKMAPKEEKTCTVRLDFSYQFPKNTGIEYSVKYKALNPKYKDMQEDIMLESKTIKFTR